MYLLRVLHYVDFGSDVVILMNEPFYLHGITLIPAWASNHTPSKVWDEIIYPFLIYFNGCIFEAWEWISNPSHTSYNRYKVIHVSKMGPNTTASVISEILLFFNQKLKMEFRPAFVFLLVVSGSCLEHFPDHDDGPKPRPDSVKITLAGPGLFKNPCQNSYQQVFLHLASAWLAAVPPVNQDPGLKIHVA